MSARIFFAGVAVGAIVGGLAVSAFQTHRAATPLAENPPNAPARQATTPSSTSSPLQTPEKVVQPASDRNVPAPPAPERTAEAAPVDVAALPSPDPGDDVVRADAEMRSRGESMEQLADKMKTEARDDAWASNMENELRDYLARRPVPNALGSTTVDCRATVCRVLSVTNDEVFAAMPMTDLQAAVGGLPDESLGREVVVITVGMVADSKHPGQAIEVAFLRRAARPGNANRR